MTPSPSPSPAPSDPRLVFLGGVGEVGRNMAALEMDGRILVLDAGKYSMAKARLLPSQTSAPEARSLVAEVVTPCPLIRS